jgi:hypothetical protein
MTCTLCHDTGWLIEAKDRNGHITLELIPCLIPDCTRSGQPVDLVSVNELKLTKVSRHPVQNYVMSLARRYE